VLLLRESVSNARTFVRKESPFLINYANFDGILNQRMKRLNQLRQIFSGSLLRKRGVLVGRVTLDGAASHRIRR
jgi:hypothetical protein